MKHDDKKQIRRLKKKIKQQGNQSLRSKNKQLLSKDPEADQLLEQPQFGKQSSSGLNGLDIDSTRITKHHQQNQPTPEQLAEMYEEGTITHLELFARLHERNLTLPTQHQLNQEFKDWLRDHSGFKLLTFSIVA
jgi:hypothetical protein